MTRSLTPEPVQAQARSRGALPFGFGPRFFVALAIGMLWLVALWWSGQFLPAMLLWDALVLIAWMFDLSRIPDPSYLEAVRRWDAAPELGRPCKVSVEIRNNSRVALQATIIDETPASMRDGVLLQKLFLLPLEPAHIEYSATPRERGESKFGHCFIRYRTPLGLAERWAMAPLAQTVSVLPDLTQSRETALYLIRSRQTEIERRRRRVPGIGKEFESLRDYRSGDDIRDICWSATARRHHLVTRTYEAERSQTVWLVLDAGRLSRAKIEDTARKLWLAKLDYVTSAALSVAQAASQSGDRVGLLAYGRAIQRSIGPARGPAHIRAIIDSLTRVRAEAAEANHSLAAKVLLRSQSRRSLIVWMTDFAETPATPDVVEHVIQMSRRHLLLFAAISQPDLGALAETVPTTEAEMFRHAAALEIVQRRELLLRGLRQNGVLALELPADRLASSLVNEYLEIKDRGLL